MLSQLLELYRSLTNPDTLGQIIANSPHIWIAYVGLFLVVFAESGLLVGFFLPGDSLLFTVGIVAGAGKLQIGAIILMLTFASILGDGIGFLLGSTLGYRLFQNPKSKIFRREHLDRTHAFYERHGGKTIIYAKFVPIVRTFAAFIAGVGKMSYTRFLTFNIFGAAGWVTSMIFLGYKLGGIPIIRTNFEKVVLLIILVSILPIILHALTGKKKSATEPASNAAVSEP